MAAERPTPKKRIESGPLNLLDVYLEQVRLYPLLSPQQEILLFQHLEAGTPIATLKEDLEFKATIIQDQEKWENAFTDSTDISQLICMANLPLVVSIAKNVYFGKTKTQPLLNLIQEGNIGLTKAVNGFDYKKGNKFSTYATSCIKNEIQQALDNQRGIIRTNPDLMNTRRKILNLSSAFLAENGREPTREELRQMARTQTNATEDRINRAIAMDPNVLKIDSISHALPTKDPDGRISFLADILPDDTQDTAQAAIESIQRKRLQRLIASKIGQLPTKQAQTLALYFGLGGNIPQTTLEIAGKIGLTTRQGVSFNLNEGKAALANDEELLAEATELLEFENVG